MAIQLLALWAEDAMTLRKSPKQRVLRKYPNAYSLQGVLTGLWRIYDGRKNKHRLLSAEDTPNAAWASADRNMRRGR